MDICPYGTATRFVAWSGVQNWLFCLNIESVFCRKDTVSTIRGSTILSEALPIICIHLDERCYETIKKQWVPVLMTQCYISQPDLVSQNGYFAWKLRVVFGRKDTVATIRSSYILSGAFPIICIHIRDIMKQWVPVLMTQQHISQPDLGSKNGYLLEYSEQFL